MKWQSELLLGGRYTKMWFWNTCRCLFLITDKKVQISLIYKKHFSNLVLIPEERPRHRKDNQDLVSLTEVGITNP